MSLEAATVASATFSPFFQDKMPPKVSQHTPSLEIWGLNAAPKL